MTAEPADDLGKKVLCGSSWEREKEADVGENGSCVWANVGGAWESAAAKAAAGGLASVLVVNSDYV